MIRRDRHDIIADILRTAADGKKKTHILHRARLSYSQLELYLEFLGRNNMVINEMGIYRTTQKGFRFIKEFDQINLLFRQ